MYFDIFSDWEKFDGNQPNLQNRRDRDFGLGFKYGPQTGGQRGTSADVNLSRSDHCIIDGNSVGAKTIY
jgi:hypothetical protein